MKKIVYITAFLFSLTACKKNFELINSNPIAPGEVQPQLLLRQVIYEYGEEMSYEGYVAGNLLGQYFTQIDFNLFDRHSLSEPQFGGNPWPVIYTNLRDNEILLDLSRENSVYAVYEGPALILKAYLTAALTDIYGDVPYFEALQGLEGNTTPAYDAQSDIYLAENGILDNLRTGISLIENYTGTQVLQGDILFNGDLSLWIKMANSLRIKHLMRISAVESVSAELQSIYDSGIYLQTSDPNAAFDFSDGPPNNFRMATLREGDFNLFILSKTAQEILEDLTDPRLEIFYRPIAADPSGNTFNGLLNGPDASTSSISVADYSLTGRIFREETGSLDANFITSWETGFLLTEAAERGLISADAEVLYNSAVEDAMDYWGADLPADYLSSGEAAYGFGGADKIEQIITQKWIANCINGYEGWIEFRRTGFPRLKDVDASLNAGLFPVRMPYPADEAALNPEAYQNATAENGNSVNAPVWWDLD
jgi:hypothetical protein